MTECQASRIEPVNESGTREPSETLVPTITAQNVPQSFWLANPRRAIIVGADAAIPLTQGEVVLLDANDLWKVEDWNWYLHKSANRRYAARSEQKDGRRRLIYMHQVLALPGPGMDVDHANGDGLDNRRTNLRVCTRLQNLANMKRHDRNKLGAKGVWKHGRKFRASITQGGKTIHLGGFDTVEEAALAYREAAVIMHGEFASQ